MNTLFLSLLFGLFLNLSSAPTASALSPNMTEKIARAYRGHCSADQTVCAHFAPTEMPIHAVGRYLKMARKSIRIATYNMDVREYIDILATKIRSNVKVEFGADYKLTGSSNPVWNSLGKHPNLTRFRLPVFRGSSPQMHNKIIIIDDKVVLFGSANFTYSGLIANYENVLAIQNPEVVKKFGAELDELRNNALDACRAFARPEDACGTGEERWDPSIHKLLTEGKLPARVVTVSQRCKGLAEGYGLLDERNLPRVDLDACITDTTLRSRIQEFTQAISRNEKFADGTPTDSSPFLDKNQSQTGPIEVYFSPEDNIQRVLIRELSKALANPSKSFVLVSTNFITNRALASKLVELHQAGVRMEVFFDRGRWEDPSFQMQVEVLKPLGVTIFDNTITGPYGSNHNKMAVIGTPQELTLVNGSANWSVAAMGRNDENLVVLRQPDIVTIYTKEILSQLFVYKFNQQAEHPNFMDLVRMLTVRMPCLSALLGVTSSCRVPNVGTWRPNARSTAILSVENVPIDPVREQVWVWVRQLEETAGLKAVPLYTHEVFAGKWVATVPVPIKSSVQFKFLKLPRSFDPNRSPIPNAAWEYRDGADRTLIVAPLGVHVIRGKYLWGQP